MKALFLGSKQLGLRLFEALFHSSLNTQWQVFHPDDRGDPRNNLEAFRAAALRYGCEFTIVPTASQANDQIVSATADVVFACGWYWVLPKRVIDAVPLGCFGLHNSLLPKYRGWSPLVWSIINGDREVGASVFRFAEGVDDGDILHQVRIDLDESESIADALSRIEEEVVRSLPAKWNAFLKGEIELRGQTAPGESYCGRRTAEDGRINWLAPARQVHDFVRAQSAPYPGAFCLLADGRMLTLQKTRVDPRTYLGKPGQILELTRDAAIVSCGGSSALQILEVWLDQTPIPVRQILTSTTQRLL